MLFVPYWGQQMTNWNGMMAMAGMGMGGPIADVVLVATVDIPEHQVGLVIGRGGEQIQLIQQQSGYLVQMAVESNMMTGYRQCSLKGPILFINKARQLINDLLLEHGRNQQPMDGIVELMSIPDAKCCIDGLLTKDGIAEVILPSEFIGRIIGKGGSTIKRLAQKSGATVQFKPDDGKKVQERCLIIQGTPEQISRATQMLSKFKCPSCKTGFHLVSQCKLYSGVHGVDPNGPPNQTGYSEAMMTRCFVCGIERIDNHQSSKCPYRNPASFNRKCCWNCARQGHELNRCNEQRYQPRPGDMFYHHLFVMGGYIPLQPREIQAQDRNKRRRRNN